jgi:hypothetical protein
MFHDDAPLERKRRKNKKSRERMPGHAPATGVVKRGKTRKPESLEGKNDVLRAAICCLRDRNCFGESRRPQDRCGNPRGGSVFRNAGAACKAVWIATGLRPSQ